MTAYLATHFVMVLLLAYLVCPASAQESYRDFEKELNLTDAQRQQVEGINKKYIGEWQNLKNEAVRRRLELQEVDQGSPAGRERARKLESELQGNRASRENLYRQYKGEVYGVLNEQQRGRYDKFVDGERQRGMMPGSPRRGMMPDSPRRGMMPDPRQKGYGR